MCWVHRRQRGVRGLTRWHDERQRDTSLGIGGPGATVLVTGENSSWAANDTLISITGLSFFSVKDNASASFDFGNLGLGLLEVHGAGSELDFHETLNVGVQDEPSNVDVQAGGYLYAKTLNISGTPGNASEVSINGADSVLNILGTTTVGAGDSGVLKVLGGATAHLSELRSGTSDSSEAFVLVQGSNSTMNADDVVLGSPGGSAALEVSQGGTMNVSGTTSLGIGGPGATVLVTGENSSWAANDTLISITGLSFFSVKDNASASFDFGNLGLGLLEVHGAGSELDFHETLNVGVQDEPSNVDVQAGGYLYAKTLNISGTPGNASEVSITAPTLS